MGWFSDIFTPETLLPIAAGALTGGVGFAALAAGAGTGADRPCRGDSCGSAAWLRSDRVGPALAASTNAFAVTPKKACTYLGEEPIFGIRQGVVSPCTRTAKLVTAPQ